jgi:ferredoxin
MMLKVKVDRLLCIGTADCVAIAPNTFELDSESKAVVIKQNAHLPDGQGDSDEKILQAAKTCPVLAIIVEDESGKQVFP